MLYLLNPDSMICSFAAFQGILLFHMILRSTMDFKRRHIFGSHLHLLVKSFDLKAQGENTLL